MMKLFINILFVFVPISAFSQIGIIGQLNNKNSGGAPPISSPSNLIYTTYGASIPLLMYEPANYDVSKAYPLLIFYHGDGAYGTWTTVTGQSLGTGNGSTVTFTGNFTNPAGANVLCTEVIFYKAGSEVGRGNRSGTITGSGVSGTIAYTATAGAISITFAVAPLAAQAITVDFKYSDVLYDAGYPIYMNSGDEPTDIFICVPQITTGDFSVVTHFDDVITRMDVLYNINLNRVYATGLSRGGFQTDRLLENRQSTLAAAIEVSGTLPSTWTGSGDIGTWFHHGTKDSTVTYALGTMVNDANVTAGSLNISPEATAYWNLSHVAAVWNTNVYNRRDRTDATGTARWDFIQWVKAYSKDQEERATLHTVRAETTKDLDDYRKAYRQVDALTAGAAKTALQSRLTTVYALIGTVYTVDYVTSGNESTTDIFKYNAKTSAASSTSISALVDIFNTASSIGFTQVNQFTTAGTKITSIPRFGGFYHGLARNVNSYGAVTDLTTTDGQVKFTGLNNSAKYTVRVNPMSWATGVTTQAQINITIGSVKSEYTEVNTYFPIEFKTITPVSGEIIIDVDFAADRLTRICSIDLILEP